MKYRGNILIAPLNWGLGHATRCIPIINLLVKYGFTPIIASDGAALKLLQQEFPSVKTIELPSYNIKYSKYKHLIKIKMLLDSPGILRAIKSEKKLIDKIVKEYLVQGIISDNRLGVYNVNIKSVIITHQLRVLSGNTTWLSTSWHQKLIENFDECWIPDYKMEGNLSGKLSNYELSKTKLKYIGTLSRFNRIIGEKSIDILILISGPEPQRSMLETKMRKEVEGLDQNIVMVRGVVEDKIIVEDKGALKICNYMLSEELELTINESKMIICRSGYTTLMDLSKLRKKAFLIPTPGQFEQEYLAERMAQLNIAPYCHQHEFKIEKLDLLSQYSGFQDSDYQFNFKKLFSLFQGK